MQHSQRNETCWEKRNKVKYIIRNKHFAPVTFPESTKGVKQGILVTLRFLHSLSKTKLMETKIAEINAPLKKWSGI